MRRPLPWGNPVWFLLLGIAGFWFGVGLLLLGAAQPGPSDRFIHTQGFAVWAATIGVQTAYWAVAAGPLWFDVAKAWRQVPSGRASIVALAIALGLILIVFPFFSLARQIDWPLWAHSTKVRALTVIGGAAVGVPALVGIALVQRHLKDRESLAITLNDTTVAVQARSQILRFLSIAGAVIGLAVLAAGALRKATVPGFVSESELPPEGIILYGAFFTGLLLLVYVPAHVALKHYCIGIREHFFPTSEIPAPNSDDFKAWLDKRSALEGLLQLNVSVSHQLQASLFILAPLLSAVITTLVPKPT